MVDRLPRGIADDPDITDDDVVRMLNVVRFLRDPGTPALSVLGGAVLVGFGGIVLGWRAAARTLAVPLQTPALVSGGFGGIAIIATACLVASIHLSRRDAAREDNQLDRLIDEAYELLKVAPDLRNQLFPKASSAVAAKSATRPADLTAKAPVKTASRTPARTAAKPRAKAPARSITKVATKTAKTPATKASPGRPTDAATTGPIRRVGVRAVVSSDKNPIA